MDIQAIFFFGSIILGFIFTLYYFISLFNNKGSLGFKIIGGIIVILYGMFAYGLTAMPAFVKCVRYDNRYIRCLKGNIGQIQFAVEMYNMDQKEENMMHNLDMELLKKGGYLKKLEDSYPDCEYYNEGDLTKDKYYIVCKRCGNWALNEQKKKELREQEKHSFKGFCISLACLIGGFNY